VPTLVQKQQPQPPVKAPVVIPANETPKERIARQKREAADIKAQELSIAAKNAQQNYNMALKHK